MRLKIGEPQLVFAPEMNQAVAKWGVYAIPRLWRVPSGELVVRFNGEEDSSDVDNMQRVPNRHFLSRDNGESWEPCEYEEKYSISVLTGIDPPYRRLKNGDTVFVKNVPHLPPIQNTPCQKEFPSANGDAILHSYRWGDLPPECRRLQFGRIDGQSGTVDLFDTTMDFPEREIHVVAKANVGGTYADVDEYVQPHIFRLPYFSAVCECGNELVAVTCGQHPDVADRHYTEVYLIASSDGGKTWKKRATVAGGITDMPFGYGGDGAELSLSVDDRGDLYCVMRMDLSTDPRLDIRNVTDTMLCISRDGGYTWSAPRAIADSSVTPHIVTLGEALLLIYGRPGVHVKLSTDRGETWSEPYSLIGKTLEEERRAGRSDFESKYGRSCSYSNTFWERISDTEILVLYNDLTYPDQNGVATKAAFVRRIGIEEENNDE